MSSSDRKQQRYVFQQIVLNRTMFRSDGVCTIWEDNSPDSLTDLAARCVLRNPQTILYVPSSSSSSTMGGEAAACLPAPTLPQLTERFDGGVDDDDDDDVDGDVVVFRRKSFSNHPLKLLPGLHLPTEICEKLLSVLYDLGLDLDDRTARAFGDSDTLCRLRRLNLRHSSVATRGLCSLLANNQVRELDVVGCRRLSPQALEVLNSHSSHLVELNLSMTASSSIWNDEYDDWNNGDDDVSCILPGCVIAKDPDLNERRRQQRNLFDAEEEEADDEWDEEDMALMKYADRGYILNAPALQRLCLRNLTVSGPEYFPLLFNRLTNLTHLDLSNCKHREGMSGYEWLPEFFAGHLVYLVLHNADGVTDEAIEQNIVRLAELRHLDVSHHETEGIVSRHYHDPDRVLKSIVQKLPHLSALDISGTNLAGTGSFRRSSSSSSASSSDLPKCDIPGLVDRVDRPLEFLGLYKAVNDANSRAHIPAKEVSGDFNVAQLLVAGQRYINRPDVMESVLKDLCQIVRYENCIDYKGALDVVLLAMDRHPSEKVIQISGSACIYYVVKGEILGKINTKVKRKILSTVLNAMYAHKDDPVMMRNSCLTLGHFQIPQDFTEDFERLVRILLYIVSCHGGDELNFVQLAGICFLNMLACQVDGRQKLLVGDMGAVEKMLALIRLRLRTKLCDSVMENAWSTMWNVTDETPINCQRFLDGDGMQLFLRCKEEFPEKENLLRNMMGLLGNVAEVPSLRPELMTQPFVTLFANLLDSPLDGIEVSYNAAGVLAHMASDGCEAWTIEEPSREEVMNKMVNAIERWKLSSQRNINYRSFEPILHLVRVTHTPQCQHWAIWALANLTKVDVKYCSLFEKEGGLVLLEQLINSSLQGGRPYKRVIELATIVRDNVFRWKEQDASSNDDDGGVEMVQEVELVPARYNIADA